MKKKHSKVQLNNKRVLVWVFIGVAIFVFLYCIACNVISYLDDMPVIVQTIFGLSDVANTAIGALLGFGASLLLDNYLVNVNKEKAIDNVVAEITQMCLYISKIFSKYVRTKNSIELEENDDIKKLLDRFDNKINGIGENSKYGRDVSKGLSIIKNRIIHCRYNIYLPIWDSILQNGDLLRFKEKQYFECLINVYTRLNKFKAQIDAFDSSLTTEKLFTSVFELYNDVQRLSQFICANSGHFTVLCQYLKGEINVKLKEEFLAEFNLIEH